MSTMKIHGEERNAISRKRKRIISISVSGMPSILLALLLMCVATRSVRAGWIDPDTPLEARTTMPINVRPAVKDSPVNTAVNYQNYERQRRRHHNVTTKSPAPTVSPAPSNQPSSQPSSSPTFIPRNFELVFSDEFNTPFRSFEDGSDPRWTALDKNDYTNDALHYYSPKNIETRDGHLVITSEAADTDIVGFDDVKRKRTRVTKHFRSGMLQSWNKFCFTGGIIEAEVILPGKAAVGGLWPAFWLLGNLARHTYVGSSEHIWPWSSVICTIKSGYAQKISGCQEVAHYGR